MENVISVNNLKKIYKVKKKESGLIKSISSFINPKYEKVMAVRDISFSINEGELVGFIGPNGAGKTTTLKCLSGLLFPNSGYVNVLDFIPYEKKENFLKEISLVMGQKNQLIWDLPPMDTFLLNKEIYEIPNDKFSLKLKELSELLGVTNLLDIPVRKMSLGERMKCELIASLIHSPKILFLDEPTIGLDIVAQKNMRDFIKTYNKKFKATIILTSHYMGDVSELCKRIIIINKGEIIFDGLIEDIFKKYGHNKILSIVFSADIDPKKLENIGEIKYYDFPKAVILVSKEQSNLAASELLRNFPISDLNIEEPDLESIVREIFTGKNKLL